MKARSAIMLVYLGCLTSGCSAPHYWLKGPTMKGMTDGYTVFAWYSTFTCVPYSQLVGDSSIGRKEENAMMFSLANTILSRGYNYTTNLDSADFIATIRVSDNFNPNDSLQLPSAPVFR